MVGQAQGGWRTYWTGQGGRIILKTIAATPDGGTSPRRMEDVLDRTRWKNYIKNHCGNPRWWDKPKEDGGRTGQDKVEELY